MNNNLLFENLLTAKEVAVMLGIHFKTVYAWGTKGKIPRIKLKRMVRFRRGEIVRWLAKQK